VPVPFDWTVVTCSSREAAEAEAQRRQASEPSDAVWIFLHVDGQWAAKRTPADPEAVADPQVAPTPLRSRIGDAIVDFVTDPDVLNQL
jgi:hypothetical protein